MKKQLFILALAGLALTSCDPEKATGSFDVNNPTVESLMQGATFKQFNGIKAEDGTMTYEPCEDGNYIEFNLPNVQAVTIYYIKADGSQSILDYGRSGGMFYFRPTRGSEPVQTLYFKYVNADLKEVIAEKQFTLQVAQELAPGDKLLCSNSGTKKWYWGPTATNGGAVWGNAGYQAGPVDNPTAGCSGAWWGCGTVDGDCPDTFNGQLQHSAAGAITGEEYSGSYMEFSEEGTITKHGPDGNVIGSAGTYKLEGYKGGEQIGDYYVAKLQTSEGAILWPYAINTGGTMPTEFEVAYLSVDKMMLIYAAPGTGGWGECTWWSFVNYDDAEGFLTADKWGWHPTNVNGGAVWGNAGYMAGAQSNPDDINGAWWGCGPLDGPCGDTFNGQLQHSAAGAITGEEYMTSAMTFGEDGVLTVFDNKGNKMREGTWAIEMKENPETFSLGTLTTSAGAILWPYAINTGGQMPTEFEIGYISGSNMTLIYAAPGTGGWAECTWWSFSKR